MNAPPHRDRWIDPRPYTDPSLRRMKHGRILPLDEPAASPLLRFAQVALGGALVLAGFVGIWLIAMVMA